MAKRSRRTSKKAGLMPGSVVYVGKEREGEARLEVLDYTDSTHKEIHAANLEECFPFRDSPSMSWINLSGIHDTAVIEKLGAHFGLHPLALEDIVNAGHRPKIEDVGEHIMVVVKSLQADAETGLLKVRQVSVVFGHNWVLSFQESGSDAFAAVRQRILKTIPRVRFLTSDYLAYALIDSVVDHYFVTLEEISDVIEAVDDKLSAGAVPENLHTIRDLKQQMILLRKAVWPLREIVAGLERTDSDLVKESTSPYLRDLYEHAIQVVDTAETYRDMTNNLLDLYHTRVSNRMNEIMQVLTIIATIFIPLGFLAGVYGMNFDTTASSFNLPELGLPYGYLGFWGIVIAVAAGMLVFFRKNKWL